MLTQWQGWNKDCAVTTKFNNPALLHTHGGSVVLGKNSILERMGLVKRKATKAARKLPDDSGVSSRSSFNCEGEGCSI